MAGTRDITFRIGVESDTSGADKVADSLKGVSAATDDVAKSEEALAQGQDKAAEGLKRAGEEAEKAAAANDKLKESTKRVVDESGLEKWFEQVSGGSLQLTQSMETAATAVEKLSDPNLAPRALQMAVLQAEIATDQLATAIERTKATGGPVDPAMTAKLTEFRTATNEANVRAGELRDKLGDLRASGKLAAETFETLSSRVGSLRGALALAADAGGPMLQIFAKAGLAAIALKESLVVLKGAADGVVTASKMIGDAYVNQAERQAKLASDTIVHANAVRQLGGQYGVLASSQDAIIQRWLTMIEHTNHASREFKAFAEGVAGAKVPETFQQIADKAINMNTSIALAFKQGEEYALRYALANKKSLDEIAEAYRIQGERVPEYIDKAIKSIEKYEEAEKRRKKAIEDSKHAVEDHSKALAKQQEAELKVAEAIKKVVEANAAEVNAARKSADSARSTAEAKIKALNEEGVKGEEYWKRKKAILAEETAAVDEATARELAANKKNEESIGQVARQYGMTSEQLKIALEHSNNYAKAVEGVTKADEGLKSLSHELLDGMARQSDGINQLVPEYERWSKAVEGVTTKTETTVIPATEKTTTKTKELGKSMSEASQFAGELGVAFDKLPSKFDETASAADRATAALKRLSDAQRQAS